MLHNRIPNIAIIGLVIITVLFAILYFSCSKRMQNLQDNIEHFEDRIRLLITKVNAQEKINEIIGANEREVREEKADVQKQLDGKHSEMKELNDRCNKYTAEIEQLKLNEKNLSEHIKQMSNLTEVIQQKDATLKKLQADFDEQIASYNQQIDDLKDEVEELKRQVRRSRDEPDRQRYRRRRRSTTTTTTTTDTTTTTTDTTTTTTTTQETTQKSKKQGRKSKNVADNHDPQASPNKSLAETNKSVNENADVHSNGTLNNPNEKRDDGQDEYEYYYYDDEKTN